MVDFGGPRVSVAAVVVSECTDNAAKSVSELTFND
jgi:hypothetical protein